MGIAERREREKEQRKQAIIDAAEKVFFSKGFENATVDDIANEAEFSKGTLYLYFKSKEEIYLAIILRGMKLMGEIFEARLKKSLTGLETVRELGRGYMEFYFKYPEYMNAMMYYENMEILLENEKGYADCDDFYTKTTGETFKSLDILVESIERGIKDGSVSKELDPVKTAIILWGEITGMLMVASMKKSILEKKFNVTAEEILEEYLKYTARALAP